MVCEPDHSPKTRPIHARAFTQARELQELLMDAANSEEITPAALAQVARAWSELEERKRVLKMKPAPKPIDVSVVKPKRQRTSPVVMVDPATPGSQPPV